MIILRWTLRLIVAALIILFAMYVNGLSFWLMNEPNQFALLGGVVLFIAVTGLSIYALFRLFGIFTLIRKAKTYYEAHQ